MTGRLQTRKVRELFGKPNWNEILLAPGLFGLGLFSSFASQLALSHVTTAHVFGLYVLIYNAATVFSGLGAAGFDLSAIRFVALAEDRGEKRYLAAFLRIAALSILGMAVISAILFVVYINFDGSVPASTSVIAALIVLFWSCTRGMAGVLRGFGSLSLALAIDRVSRDLFVLIFGLLAIAITLSVTISTALSALLLGTMLGFAAGAVMVGRRVGALRKNTRAGSADVDGAVSREWRTVSLGLMAYGCIELLSSRFDVFILSLLAPPEAVGAFGIALLLINLVTIPSGFIGLLIMPRVAVAYDRLDLPQLRALYLQTSLIAVASGLFVVVVVWISKPLLMTFIPHALLTMLDWNLVLAAMAVRALCLVSTFPAALLTMTGRHKALIVSNLLTMVLRISLFAVFLNEAGAGLAVATFAAGAILSTIINVVQVRRQLWPLTCYGQAG